MQTDHGGWRRWGMGERTSAAKGDTLLAPKYRYFFFVIYRYQVIGANSN